ncbi:MAG: arsenic efflux protein [Blautia sp.]|nr:arsenic efflux protein [Blautia sp.]
MTLFIDILKDALLDTAKLLPFLFLTYLAMEYLENCTTQHTVALLRNRRLAPILGGTLGVIPQCGFSSAAASLYSGGVITIGTLMAVFLSTSDEMLPLLLAGQVPAKDIIVILSLKVLFGIVTGLIIDGLVQIMMPNRKKHSIHELCEREHGDEESENIFKSAFLHTAKVSVFLFLITFLLGFIMESASLEHLLTAAQSMPLLCLFLSALIGLIPNCASSVAITTLYLEGVLAFPAMMAGLLSCAGIGLMVLFRTNRSWKENLLTVVTLYGSSVACGLVLFVIL